jgi:hypothetical protein
MGLRKILCRAAVFFMLSLSVYANESRIVSGGSIKIIDNENTGVVMEEEEINITLHQRYYEVDVIFKFFNTGSSEKILAGFPISSYISPYSSPEDRELIKAISFRSYVNGSEMRCEPREEITTNERGENKTIWYTKEIEFPPNRYTTIRNIYWLHYSASGFYSTADYIYGTGYNWKNAIGKITVNIKHNDTIIIEDFDFGSLKDKNPKQAFQITGDGEYRFVFNNIEPEENDSICVYGKDSDYHSIGDDRYLGWIWNEQYIDEDESGILMCTRNQVQQWIRRFYTNHAVTIFGKTLFYTPFNSIERRNIAYLRKLEQQIP